MFYTQTNAPIEFSFTAGEKYRDIFNEIEVDVLFTGSAGEKWRVPAFWEGENTFRVRFSAPTPGRYTYRTVCTNSDDRGLHNQTGELEIVPYEGKNPLYQHGGLRVGQTKRTLEHTDGTPFFWLGDTWWMGLCKRLHWPGDFQTLTADRIGKGFTVIQIVAGLYPDMPPFDERGANEAGFPWEKNYERINPAYFDMADLRINWLVKSGLIPCIVGCWGYFLPRMGLDKMKEHWRNLVARYGAYPVVWCLAGEWDMPYYLSNDKIKEADFQKKGWAEIARYIRSIDGLRRPLSVHEGTRGRELGDGTLIDFEMLQTGHGDRESLPNTVKRVIGEYAGKPTMPVINSEVCYEGICESCRQEVQRLMFWVCMLNGTAGHTYGANGIWQLNTREKPFGPSPHGGSWGNTPWEDAHQLPGSGQVGLGKRLLERYKWWRFEPHSEWVEPHWSEENYFGPYAAGIPREVRIIFLPHYYSKVVIKGIESGAHYRVFRFNPTNGEEQDLGEVKPDGDGNWCLSPDHLPIFQDWVLVLEAYKSSP